MSTKSKVTFSIDLNKDPDLIFDEIKLRIERELKRKGSSDRAAAFLSKLHEISNEHVDSNFKTTNDLIRALADFASPAMKDRILDSSPSGRRKTISMNKELFEQIADLLSKPNPNKAEIARKTGVSVVQVRKVAFGGYDKRYGRKSSVKTKTPRKQENGPASGGQTSLTFNKEKSSEAKTKPVPAVKSEVTRPPMRPKVKSPLDL